VGRSVAEDNQQSPPPFSAEGKPSLLQLADYFADALTDPERLRRVEDTLANGSAKAGGVLGAAAVKVLEPLVRAVAVPIALVIGETLVGVLESTQPLNDSLGKLAVNALLGEGKRRTTPPDNIGARIMARLAPAAGPIEPSFEGAQRAVTLVADLEVESWVMGVVGELLGESIDLLGHAGGAIEQVAQLREIVMDIFGGRRIARRALAPIIDDGIVTPAKWATAKQYRPTLLSAGAAAEAYMRGDWTLEQLTEELARQGWSDERILVTVDNARKRLTIEELIFRHFRGEISDVETAQLARALGYDEATTAAKLAIEDAKRIDVIHAPIVNGAVSSYISGDIDDRDLERWVNGAAPNATDAARIVASARDRRAIGVKRITAARMRALVLEGIANVEDFRQALERENYAVEDATLEELSLRAELAKKNQPAKKDATLAQLETAVLDGSIDLGRFQDAPAFRALTSEGQAIELAIVQAKIDKRDADAAAKAADAEAKAAKDAELEAKRSRAFPALTEYRTAYVRGYIDRATYAAALTREKVVDSDAAFLLAGADAEREKWLEDQARRTQALADAEHRGLSLAEREQAVLKGILTLHEFDASLVKDKLVDDDRRVLVDLLQAKIDDQDAADAKRREAEAAAQAKDASVAQWEQAVLLGVRTLDEYGAFLASLPLNDAARALLVDALAARLVAADKAKATRDARDAAALKVGISLAQRRRAVIAGVRPRAYYEAALVDANWPVNDQLADLDLLDTEIAAAQAARDKRDQVVAKASPSMVSIGQLERALTLGLITPAEFVDAVTARGASDDDAALLVQLAIAKVPDARTGAQLHDQVSAELAAKGVSLADLDSAVRRGLMTITQFGDALAGRGYGEDAIALLAQLLQDRLDVDVDGLRKKLDAALAKVAGAPSLDELEQQVADGSTDTSDFQGALVDAGAPRDAALVYARLVASGALEG
jgi:hypothetical protein